MNNLRYLNMLGSARKVILKRDGQKDFFFVGKKLGSSVLSGSRTGERFVVHWIVPQIVLRDTMKLFPAH